MHHQLQTTADQSDQIGTFLNNLWLPKFVFKVFNTFQAIVMDEIPRPRQPTGLISDHVSIA